MSSLIYSSKIEVKKSPIHGYGVFAKEDIKKDEILEECHFISLPKDNKYLNAFIQLSDLIDFVFVFPKGKDFKEWAWPLGNGCIYNSSPNSNADWEIDENKRLFIFKSIKDIKKGNEICTNYEKHREWCKKIKSI